MRVLFYAEIQKVRNGKSHNLTVYRLLVINWYNNIKNMIVDSNEPEMRKYIRAQRLNVDKYNLSYIRNQAISTIEMFKIARKEHMGDIRQYFCIGR